MPSITSPATSDHRVGKVIWLDLETTHLATDKAFYSGLFGWEFRDYQADGMDYAVAMQGGRPVAGMLQRQVRKGEERRSASAMPADTASLKPGPGAATTGR